MDAEREWAERYLWKLAWFGWGGPDPLPRSGSRERIDTNGGRASRQQRIIDLRAAS